MYFHISAGYGQRGKWHIYVKAGELIACCEERMKHHTERMGFWMEQQSKAEKELRSEKGVGIAKYEVSGGQRSEIKINQGLAERVIECERKAKSHQASFNEFHAFRAMFRFIGDEAKVECDIDDVLYFNIKQADTGKEEP